MLLFLSENIYSRYARIYEMFFIVRHHSFLMYIFSRRFKMFFIVHRRPTNMAIHVQGFLGTTNLQDLYFSFFLLLKGNSHLSLDVRNKMPLRHHTLKWKCMANDVSVAPTIKVEKEKRKYISGERTKQ